MAINNGKVDDNFIFGFLMGNLTKDDTKKVSPNRGNVKTLILLQINKVSNDTIKSLDF